MVEKKEAKAERLPKEVLKEEAQRLLETARDILRSSPLVTQAIVDTFFGSGEFFSEVIYGVSGASARHRITPESTKEVSFSKGNFRYSIAYKEDKEEFRVSIDKGELSKDPEYLKIYEYPLARSEVVNLAILINPTEYPDDTLYPAVIQYLQYGEVHDCQMNTPSALKEAERFLNDLKKDFE